MINAETANLLQQIVRREGRSVLIYVGDAFPWTTANDGESLTRLNDVIRAEDEAISAIRQFLQRNRLPLTSHGSYPASFTTINFLALKHILPRLISYERDSIPVLERELAKITRADASAVVQNLLDVKHRNLAALEGLMAPQPKSAA